MILPSFLYSHSCDRESWNQGLRLLVARGEGGARTWSHDLQAVLISLGTVSVGHRVHMLPASDTCDGQYTGTLHSSKILGVFPRIPIIRVFYANIHVLLALWSKNTGWPSAVPYLPSQPDTQPAGHPPQSVPARARIPVRTLESWVFCLAETR